MNTLPVNKNKALIANALALTAVAFRSKAQIHPKAAVFQCAKCKNYYMHSARPLPKVCLQCEARAPAPSTLSRAERRRLKKLGIQ